ncbi:hypothetical protein EHYA_08713 [Embleya hyalina]|uniref:Uncharacterized protein n=1 Tax=Embleya hyalina TaxID=516124 RepID=A0A401Z2B5_9ACTN|nr:hypothetical protein EHYA_08713 [Embleya hyalina]
MDAHDRPAAPAPPRGSAPRTFVGRCGSGEAELLPPVARRCERVGGPGPPPDREARPLVVGDRVRINADGERTAQPDGEIVVVDVFPPGRSVIVQPPGNAMPWVRWEHEVHRIPIPPERLRERNVDAEV